MNEVSGGECQVCDVMIKRRTVDLPTRQQAGRRSWGRKECGLSRGSRVSTAKKLVTIGPLTSGHSIPIEVRPVVAGLALHDWVQGSESVVEHLIADHGAILFRGFADVNIASFQRFAEATSSNGLIDYSYRSTPRKRIDGKIYTSTEYPADQAIALHNELSYTSDWPMKIWFCCLGRSQEGQWQVRLLGCRFLERSETRIPLS